jgi:hypothetical protein
MDVHAGELNRQANRTCIQFVTHSDELFRTNLQQQGEALYNLVTADPNEAGGQCAANDNDVQDVWIATYSSNGHLNLGR